MKYIKGIFYSLPVQLLFLHFRKYQLLLVFWVILFATVSGSFAKIFGADAMFLAPEYLGDVNALSAAFMGVAIAVFIMCWNITTFILYSRHFSFLAATNFPFLKYCINNSIIPLTFLLFFLVRAYHFAHYKELIPNLEIAFLGGGFLSGLFLILVLSFFYFFTADKTILRRMQPHFNNPKHYLRRRKNEKDTYKTTSLIKSEWFLDSFFSVRRCRDVSHYTQSFLESIFRRHHSAAVLSIGIAILFLIIIGFFQEYRLFQIPAAASITLLLAIFIGVMGAFAYFLQSWSVPVLVLFLLALNAMYHLNWIDPRNKAYGLNYGNTELRPAYSREHLTALASPANVASDRQNMNGILGRWKKKQGVDKPLLVLINTSGGGNRSATFTMNVLQRLDSVTGGRIMKNTFLISGASGGMIGAAYFRELYRQNLLAGKTPLQRRRYTEDIGKDLLNPTFSSFVARDLFAPARRFEVGPYSYVRDRAYSFEMKLNENTGGLLDRRLQDYVADESAANIPLLFLHSVVTRDGKKMLISTVPTRFMMQPADSVLSVTGPDLIDFTSFFARQNPYNLRLLTALRMNATFPIVLPNVWLPSEPVIDVMDGGLRDNFGMETCLRFLTTMQDWVTANTSGVLVIQIRDRPAGGWDNPFELEGLSDHAIKPMMLLQNNWHKMMLYAQNDMLASYALNAPFPVHKVAFQYDPEKEENKAALNFHLTQREKRDIALSLDAKGNADGFARVGSLLQAGGPRFTDKLAERTD